MYKAFFEIPVDFRKRGKHGSSPKLLRNLMNELEGAQEIWISMFLYNNPYLHEFLKKKAAAGTKVVVISIPLSGYSDQPYEVDGYRAKRSKREFAQQIYEDPGAIDLRIFPHTYVWKRKQVKRGSDVYSLHVKCMLAKFTEGFSKCVLTSSNMACGDPSHSENMLVTAGDPDTTARFTAFFESLYANTLDIPSYQRFLEDNNNLDAHYSIAHQVDWPNLDHNQTWFTGPWIRCDSIGSNQYARKRILDLISNAQNRIYLCAQHFNDFRPFGSIDGARSIVDILLEAAGQKNIDIRLLTQTTSAHQEEKGRTIRSEEALIGNSKIEQRYLSPIIHDKFIIADDAMMVMTANMTSTQYAWDDDREMQYEVDGVEFSVLHQCFSEVNAFQVVKDAAITRQYEQHFSQLWERATKVIVRQN
ncbi:phospholipase D-like domain-containing protein [Cohnella luojiensis]|uniref:phospholipase D n=1 Tax=Cohnella luojiensis TaxID=652876 RepID=A0A4Y8LWJ0_9BACL|nr:phospholipase D-like domain-containing protein [Cohnella luojiensis]TFE25598.1 hypothetical protein E2980_13505 [Cohnella luojiensis]